MQCPNCRRNRLNYLPWLGSMYECGNCGFRTPIALSDPRKDKPTVEKKRKVKKVRKGN